MPTPRHEVSPALSRTKLVRLRDIARWWPLLLATTVIAMTGTWWAHHNAIPSYTSTTRVVVVPLPQWDETFLGTDLVRDSGDATRTALTFATELESNHYAVVTAGYLGGDWTPESVAAAISIAPASETNIVEIVAQSPDADVAKRLASGFATAMMTDRWQVISTELESRIAALRAGALTGAGDQQGNNPAGAEQVARLQTLQIVLDDRADPTLRVGSAGPPVRDSQMSLVLALLLAAAGGAFIGALAAASIEFLRRGKNPPVPETALAVKPYRGADCRVLAAPRQQR